MVVKKVNVIKRKTFRICVLLLSVLFLYCFASCKMAAVEETYTVWTDSSTYSDFKDVFETTLDDGYYWQHEMTSREWGNFYSLLTKYRSLNWSKDKIRDYFIGRGFGSSEATQEAAWLTTVEHGFVASRTGSTIYYIFK